MDVGVLLVGMRRQHGLVLVESDRPECRKRRLLHVVLFGLLAARPTQREVQHRMGVLAPARVDPSCLLQRSLVAMGEEHFEPCVIDLAHEVPRHGPGDAIGGLTLRVVQDVAARSFETPTALVEARDHGC